MFSVGRTVLARQFLIVKGNFLKVLLKLIRYNVEADRWEEIAEANKKRYAGSAIGIAQQKKVFLFGGRSDFNKYFYRLN